MQKTRTTRCVWESVSERGVLCASSVNAPARCVCCTAHHAPRTLPPLPSFPCQPSAQAAIPVEQCKEAWFDQRLDHFRWWTSKPGGGAPAAAADPAGSGSGSGSGSADAPAPPRSPPPASWRQRYFTCDRFWTGPGAPIFFYAGNEGPVEGYINSAGAGGRGKQMRARASSFRGPPPQQAAAALLLRRPRLCMPSTNFHPTTIHSNNRRNQNNAVV